MNTAISFATMMTWQAYGGETTMTYVSQVLGLASQNFLAGAAGLAAGIAFIRGLARQRTRSLGNFWVDVTRATLWVLLPLAFVGTLGRADVGRVAIRRGSRRRDAGADGTGALGAGSTPMVFAAGGVVAPWGLVESESQKLALETMASAMPGCRAVDATLRSRGSRGRSCDGRSRVMGSGADEGWGRGRRPARRG